MRFLACSALAAALICAAPAGAAVVDTAINGFEVQENVHIAATPDKVYAAIIQPGHWWSSQHSFSGDAGNMTLDADGGGCWCEALPNGGSVQLMIVEFVAPGKMLRLSGALGPFQAFAMMGTMTFALKDASGGTDLTLTYDLGGYMKGGLGDSAKAADGVLDEQAVRLKRYIETGSPDPHP